MIKKETLPNGVRIVTEEIPFVRSVSMGIWVGAGSRDESMENNGIAHFIEHMMFKGTTKRTAKEIAETLDAVGGQLNAFTSKEYTCYYAKVLDDHFDIAVDLLSDMFFNSVFKEEDVEKEKNVILEEIKMYEDTPDELVHDIFTTALWKDHPLGRPVIGIEDIINKIGRNEMLKFRDRFYTGNSLVVAVAGNVKHEEIVKKLAPIFEKIKPGDKKSNYTPPVNFSQTAIKQKDTEQVHLCVGTPGLELDHENLYVLHIMNSVLGGGISSRLFQEIREERGLVYSVFTYHSSFRDAGLFSIYAGLSKNNLELVVSLISKELKNLREKGITSEELIRAKEQIKGSMFLGLENVSNRMSRLGKSELCMSKILTVDEVVDKINMVSQEQVLELARNFFQEKNITVSAIGPDLKENQLKIAI